MRNLGIVQSSTKAGAARLVKLGQNTSQGPRAGREWRVQKAPTEQKRSRRTGEMAMATAVSSGRSHRHGWFQNTGDRYQ